MSTRSGRIRTSAIEPSPPRTRPSRSPGRPRKISPVRKSPPAPPARQTARKSPARKTLSPSRKTPSKFPARKSPARTTKETAEPAAPAAPKSPIKRLPLKTDVSVRLENFSAKFESLRSTRSKRSEYSIKDVTSTQSDFSLEKLNGIEPLSDIYGLRNRRSVEEVPPRRSSRLREFIDPEPDISNSVSKSRSQSKSVSKSVSKSIDAYSDEENSAEESEKSKLITRKLSTPLRHSISNINQIASRYEFGGRVGSIALMILIPLTVVSILTSCMKSCSFNTLISFSPFKSLKLWFSLPTSIIVVTQVFLQVLFAILPIFGPWADRMDDTDNRYCFNGLFASVLTVNFLYGLDFFQIINKDVLLRDYLKLATGFYIFAVLLSITLYVKSRKVNKNELNPYGNSGYFLYDFFMGTEIHPQLKKLDVKILISRICNINTLILTLLICTQGVKLEITGNEKLDLMDYQDIWNKISLQPTIILFSMFQIVYILGYITKEYRLTTTFYWHSEGVGYLQTVSSALYPFYFTTLSKYVADTNLMLSTNTLICASVLFLLGFAIMLASNSIKYEFRRNPLQSSFANLESMPTFHGNKLIISGLWGALRHPNYTGDILMHIAMSLPGILSGSPIAAAPALITILVLMHRAWRDHARCNRRYGAAWHRYCKKVPSVIVPKVL